MPPSDIRQNKGGNMDIYKTRSTWWSGNCYHLEQLTAIINSVDVRSYAYILHDKCKKENSEELKKPHYHFLVQLTKDQRGSWFKQFNGEDIGIVFIEPTRSPVNAFNYLIHDTEKCRKEKAYLYDPSERISTIEDFTSDEKENEHEELCKDLFALLDRKMTWHEFIRKNPKRIYSISSFSKAHELLSGERSGGYRYYEPQPRPQPPPPRPQQQTYNGMRVLSPDECKDLPW